MPVIRWIMKHLVIVFVAVLLIAGLLYQEEINQEIAQLGWFDSGEETMASSAPAAKSNATPSTTSSASGATASAASGASSATSNQASALSQNNAASAAQPGVPPQMPTGMTPQADAKPAGQPQLAQQQQQKAQLEQQKKQLEQQQKQLEQLKKQQAEQLQQQQAQMQKQMEQQMQQMPPEAQERMRQQMKRMEEMRQAQPQMPQQMQQQMQQRMQQAPNMQPRQPMMSRSMPQRPMHAPMQMDADLDKDVKETWVSARTAFWQGDADKAEALYKSLMQSSSEADVAGELGNVYFTQRRYDEAANMYFEAGQRHLKGDTPMMANVVIGPLSRLAPEKAQELRKQIMTAQEAFIKARRSEAENKANSAPEASTPETPKN